MAAKKQRRIVIALDETSDSDHLLDKAIDDELREDDEVHLFHAFTYDPQTNMGALDQYQLGQADKELHDEANQQQREKLDEYKEVLVSNGVTNVTTVMADGPPQRAIPDYVNNLDPPATMLMLSSRRMGAVGRFLYGSVSDECVDKVTQCSVMVVPSPVDRSCCSGTVPSKLQ